MRMAGTMLMWGGVGVMALIALKIVLKLLGIVMGFVGFLFFTVLPLLVVGWLVMKLWQAFTRPPAGENGTTGTS